MDPDDRVCLCFGVTLRKIRAYLTRENPEVPSLISECLGAGTGCRWCVPFLKELHRQHQCGQGLGPNGEPDLKVSPDAYASARGAYRSTGVRPTIERTEPDPPSTGQG
ncbi:MAG: (2Fe-2S)-binding protein [Phycisphaerales bacterium]